MRATAPSPASATHTEPDPPLIAPGTPANEVAGYEPPLKPC